MIAKDIVFLMLSIFVFVIMMTSASEDSAVIPDGTIYGHVYDAQTKQPISQAFVYCQETKCPKQSTDSNGYYAIENCFSPSSTYVVECTKNGYPSAKSSAKTDSAGEAEVNFYLSTQNPPPKLDSDQAQVKSWKKTFSRSRSDIGWSIQQTTDSGYIVAARTNTNNDSYDMCSPMDVCHARGAWLIKTDANGNELWNRTFDRSDYAYDVYSVKQTKDYGYIIAGNILKQIFKNGCPDDSNIWIIKTDSIGNEQWNKTFYKSRKDKCYSIQQTIDDGYIIAGSTQSSNSNLCGAIDAWLIKMDSQGNLLWDKTFGGSKANEAKAVLQTSDNGYILTGYSASHMPKPSGIGLVDAGITPYGPDECVAWLIKTDSEGNVLWNKSMGSKWEIFRDHVFNSIKFTNDGGYLAAGWARLECAFPTYWLAKIDSHGNKQWEGQYGAGMDIGSSVQQTSDGGYIIVSRNSGDLWLIKTDPQGNYSQWDFDTQEIKKWDRTFGGPGDDHGYSVQQTNDGGYIITGFTTVNGNKQVLLIKTDANGL